MHSASLNLHVQLISGMIFGMFASLALLMPTLIVLLVIVNEFVSGNRQLQIFNGKSLHVCWRPSCPLSISRRIQLFINEVSHAKCITASSKVRQKIRTAETRGT